MPDETDLVRRTAPPPGGRVPCSRVRLMLAAAARATVCDVSGRLPDLATLDVLARAQLEACRTGRPAVLRGASEELVELLRFAGLVDVLRVEAVVAPIRRPGADPA